MMSGCEGYHAIARVYDRLNAEIDYSAWADFIESCFDRFLKVRPKLVLDLACGTGSMTLQLDRRGYDMIGIDGSADMLSRAYMRTEEGQNILFLQQDMRSFELYGTVGAITCCLDSLNYLLSVNDLFLCFSCVQNYLDKDGLFLFDVNTPFKFENIYGNQCYILEDEIPCGESEEATDETAQIYCGWQNFYHPDTKNCDFKLTLFEELPNGTYRRSEEYQTEHCFSLEEIKDTLEKAGMEFLGVWSDFRFSSPTPSCERWYIAAKAIK